MHPLNVFSLFPPFPKEDKVFVAMSFDKQYDYRWQKVIRPAIQAVRFNDVPLQPYRIDTRRINDSIMTEVLTGISNSRLILGDITAIDYSTARTVWNGNVMYEIGLAHAVRLPEEVLLFRSDQEQPMFDVANIRIHQYDPENSPEFAKQQIADIIVAAIKEIDLRKHLAVQRAVESLDFQSWNILVQTRGIIKHPVVRTFGEALGNITSIQAISRMLDLGIIRTEFLEVTPTNIDQIYNAPVEELMTYRITPFGQAVYEAMTERYNSLKPHIDRIGSELDSKRGNDC